MFWSKQQSKQNPYLFDFSTQHWEQCSPGNKEKHQQKLCFPHRDTLTISIINSLTSILAGFVIFSAFGYMSYLQGIPVSDLAVDGKKTSYY